MIKILLQGNDAAEANDENFKEKKRKKKPKLKLMCENVATESTENSVGHFVCFTGFYPSLH